MEEVAETQHQVEEWEEAKVNFEDDVEAFLINLHDFVYHRNTEALKKLFDADFHMLSGIYFKDRRWPSPQAVDDFYREKNRFHNLIHCLYEELYYRHVFNINDVTAQDRLNAWINYKCLLTFISDICTDLDQSGDANDNVLVMPDIWIYDFLMEYVNQYQSMCKWRVEYLKNPQENEEVLNMIMNNTDVFETSVVLEELHILLSKGEFSKLDDEQRSIFVNNIFHVNNTELSCKHQFGYFSCCVLLQLYVLMGDYYTALKTISLIELNHKALYWNVPLCHVSIFYNIAFCYMMLKRYSDSLKFLSQILHYINKQKLLSILQGNQLNVAQDLTEKMYIMVIICHSLRNDTLDESILQNIKENFSSRFYAMQSANEDTYMDSFLRVAPGFVEPMSNLSLQFLSTCHYSQMQIFTEDPKMKQMYIFLNAVSFQKKLAHFVSYAKLYHNIQLNKLGDMMNYSTHEGEKKNVCADVMCVKNFSKQLIWNGGSLLQGELVPISLVRNFDFYIDLDMLTIKNKTQRKMFVDYFVHQINICRNMLRSVKSDGMQMVPVFKGKVGPPKKKTDQRNRNKNRNKGKFRDSNNVNNNSVHVMQ